MHFRSKHSEENTMPIKEVINENESHVKIFSVPTRKSCTKKFVFVSVLAVSCFLLIGSFIFLLIHLNSNGKDQQQRNVTIPEINLSSNEKNQQQSNVASPAIKTNKSKFMDYLRGLSGFKIISGIFVASFGVSSSKRVKIIQNITGVSPGIISTRIPNSLSNETVWSSFTEEVISNWNNGHLVRISWWDNENPLTWMTNFTDKSNPADAEARWGDLIKDGGGLNKVWKQQLGKIVPCLHKLQTAGVIPILDILPSINFEGYMWQGRPGVNGTAKLYQITHDHLTKQHNLTSLIWTWSLYSENLEQFEHFWPGSEYVDITSIYMGPMNEISFSEYARLVNLVGDKPMSMDQIVTVPSLQLLKAQPRWTWFTAIDHYLENKGNNEAINVKATFNSISVINRGNIDFFKNKDLNIT